MQDEASLDLEARRPGEEITDWLDRVVQPSLARDHAARSPLCRSTATEYLKLPVPEDGRRIGDAKEGLN